MRIRTRGLATYLILNLALTGSVIAGLKLYRAHAEPVQSDPLDPNDCSRGLDESNQESCDLGGGQ